MKIEITEEDAPGQRLDRYLVTQLPECSRSRIQTLIKEGHILLNGTRTKPKHAVSPGDAIQVSLPEPVPAELAAEDIPLTILLEDDDLIVIDKPGGLVVHPGAGNADGTLVHALLHHCRGQLSGIGGVLRPGIVHRLDKDTSGCLVAAKNDPAHRELARQFADREVRKEYLAVVDGCPARKKGRIENRLGRHPVNRLKMTAVGSPAGKEAITEYEVLRTAGPASLIKCDLLTGRTHQIRVHLKSLGTPVLGDQIYAAPSRQKTLSNRLMLHAWKLAFKHPRTGEPLSFTAEIPPEFQPFLPEDW